MTTKDIAKELAGELGISIREVEEVINYQFRKVIEYSKTDALEIELTNLAVLVFNKRLAEKSKERVQATINRLLTEESKDPEDTKKYIKNLNENYEIANLKLRKNEENNK